MSESNLRPGNIRNFTIKGEDLSGNKTQHRNRAALVDLRSVSYTHLTLPTKA